MRRRELITLLGGAALPWPFVARAQQPAMPTVGFLGPATAAGFASYIDGFRRGLGASGFVEGRSVAVEYRWADNQLDRLPALAGEAHAILLTPSRCPPPLTHPAQIIDQS